MTELTNEIIYESLVKSTNISSIFWILAIFILIIGLITSLILFFVLKENKNKKYIIFIVIGTIIISLFFSKIGESINLVKKSDFSANDIVVLKSNVTNKKKVRKLHSIKRLGPKTSYKYYMYLGYNDTKLQISEKEYNSLEIGKEYYIVLVPKKSNDIIKTYSCDKYIYK